MQNIAFFQTKEEKIGTILCILCAIIFGLYPPAAKAAYENGANITFVVIFTTLVRFFALFAFAIYNNQQLFQTKKDRKLGLWGGLFQAISVIGILGGTYFIPGSIVIIIMFSYSLMLLFFSSYRGRYQLNIANLTLTVTALIGLALILDVFSASSYNLNSIGIGLALLAAFATFIRIYVYGMHDKDKSPAVTGAEAFLVASILLLFLCLWQFPVFPENIFGWLMVSASALSLAIGTFGIFYGVAMLGSYRFSMITKLEPLFTALFGFLLLGEILNPFQYLGMSIVIVSLLALQLLDKQK